MTRLTLTAATAQIDAADAAIIARLPNNITGIVTPADVRETMQATLQAAKDALDSASTITAVLQSTAPAIGVLIPVSWGDEGGLVPESKGGLAATLTVTGGTDIEVDLAGFDYELSAQIVVDAANTDVIQITLAEDGTPIGQIGQVVGDGVNTLRAVTACSVFNIAAGTKYTLQAQAPNGAVSVDILSATLQVRLVPTV